MGLLNRSSFTPHPPGVFLGTLSDFQLEPEGKYGPQIRWSFDTPELMPDGRPFRVSMWTSLSLGEKSKLRKFLRALGQDPDNAYWDEIGDTDAEFREGFQFLLGSVAQLVIEQGTRPDGSTSSSIANILPPGPPPAAKPASPAAAPRPTSPRPPSAPRPEPVGSAAAAKSIWSDE